MKKVELYFIAKDFLGKPVGLLSGIYEKYQFSNFSETPMWRLLDGNIHNLPSKIDGRKIHVKFIECEVGANIDLQSIDMKYCTCGKNDCSYNADFKQIITDFLNNKPKKNVSQKLDNIYEFLISIGFEPTEKQGIYKHRYFVNDNYIEFDLSACALEKWAVMQHIFERVMQFGSSQKVKEIQQVLGIHGHIS